MFARSGALLQLALKSALSCNALLQLAHLLCGFKFDRDKHLSFGSTCLSVICLSVWSTSAYVVWSHLSILWCTAEGRLGVERVHRSGPQWLSLPCRELIPA